LDLVKTQRLDVLQHRIGHVVHHLEISFVPTTIVPGLSPEALALESGAIVVIWLALASRSALNVIAACARFKL